MTRQIRRLIMLRLLDMPLKRLKHLGSDERGVTGLDAAIITIAFAVVASVFAFVALSAGLFTTDRAKETVTAGLFEARGTTVLKGSVVATAGITGAAAGEPIDMTVGNTIVRYTDKFQSVNLHQTG